MRILTVKYCVTMQSNVVHSLLSKLRVDQCTVCNGLTAVRILLGLQCIIMQIFMGAFSAIFTMLISASMAAAVSTCRYILPSAQPPCRGGRSKAWCTRTITAADACVEELVPALHRSQRELCGDPSSASTAESARSVSERSTWKWWTPRTNR